MKHGSMFTVIRCVRLCEARLWRVGHVRIGVRSLITFERGRITLRELYCTWSRRAVEAKEHHFLSVNRSRSSCGSPSVNLSVPAESRARARSPDSVGIPTRFRRRAGVVHPTAPLVGRSVLTHVPVTRRSVDAVRRPETFWDFPALKQVLLPLLRARTPLLPRRDSNHRPRLAHS